MKIHPQDIANIRFSRIMDLVSLYQYNLKIKIDKNNILESLLNQAKEIIVECVEEVNASIESEK